jgi:hypothetical protein
VNSARVILEDRGMSFFVLVFVPNCNLHNNLLIQIIKSK